MLIAMLIYVWAGYTILIMTSVLCDAAIEFKIDKVDPGTLKKIEVIMSSRSRFLIILLWPAFLPVYLLSY